jgi:hypothetical protein
MELILRPGTRLIEVISSPEYLRVKQCGATALDWAIRAPTDLLEYLIALGADINTADNVPIDHGDFH